MVLEKRISVAREEKIFKLIVIYTDLERFLSNNGLIIGGFKGLAKSNNRLGGLRGCAKSNNRPGKEVLKGLRSPTIV